MQQQNYELPPSRGFALFFQCEAFRGVRPHTAEGPKSVNAEPRVSSLKSLFRSWKKHLQPEVDSLRLNILDEGTQAVVVLLKCRLEISRMFLERIGQGGGSDNRQRPSHPYCGRSAITGIAYEGHSSFGPGGHPESDTSCRSRNPCNGSIPLTVRVSSRLRRRIAQG